jgi:hypothetical protein
MRKEGQNTSSLARVTNKKYKGRRYQYLSKGGTSRGNMKDIN